VYRGSGRRWWKVTERGSKAVVVSGHTGFQVVEVRSGEVVLLE
jgi:hypothetical protein